MNDYFTEIMKEEPPEFTVRTRKTDKEQLRQAQSQRHQGTRQSSFSAQNDGGAGTSTPTTETMRLDLSASQNQYNGGFPTVQSQSSGTGTNANHLQKAPSGISFDLGGIGGVENIQFEDTFEEQEQENEYSTHEQPQLQQQIKREDSQSALVLPQSAQARPSASPLAATPNQFSLAQPSSAIVPRAVPKLSSVQTPSIASFAVTFLRGSPTENTDSPASSSSSSSYTFHNHTVRSHSYACAKDVDCIEVTACNRADTIAVSDPNYEVSVRPPTLIHRQPAKADDGSNGGTWVIKLSQSLNTVEIKTADECYRLFISRNG